MSLGPVPRAGGARLVGLNLYETFFDVVPGFAGLRAPARFGMVAGCLLAALGGYALARLERWRNGGVALALAGAAFLAEAYAVPMPENLTWTSSARYAAPWPSIHRVNDGPLAYRYSSACRRTPCSSSCRSAIRRGISATCTTPACTASAS